MASVTVDRITISKALPMGEPFKGTMSLLYSFSGIKGAKVWKEDFVTMASLPLGGGRRVKVAIGSSHKKGFVSFDFAASALNAEQKGALDEYLVALQIEQGISDLLTTGRVTYVEFAFDFPNVEWVGFVPFDRRLRNSCWKPTYVAKNPTAYMGNKASDRVICCYDRKRKLAQVENVYVEHECARIEARLRRLGCGVTALPQQKNPLAKTGIASWAKLCALSANAEWEDFIWKCKTEGAPYALRTSPQKLRKMYLDRLVESQVEWWEPKQLWSQVPYAVEQAFQGFAVNCTH